MEKKLFAKKASRIVYWVVQHLRLASGMYGKVDLESYIGLANQVVIFRDFVNANSLQNALLKISDWPAVVAGSRPILALFISVRLGLWAATPNGHDKRRFFRAF